MISILKNRKIYIWVWLWLFVISLIMILFKDLNLWIDMTWWTQAEYSYEKELVLENIKTDLSKIKDEFNLKNNDIINWINIYKVSWENKIVVLSWFRDIKDDKKTEILKWDFKKNIEKYLFSIKDNKIVLEKYTNIWKSFWDYIKNTAIITLIIAVVAITLYIRYAFFWVVSWISTFSFALITIITLLHDVIIPTWIYIILWSFFTELQIDTFFITALLTILWYSINDTIVIFDRVRDNLRKYWWKGKDLYEIIDISLNQTFARSIYTSLTLLLVLVWVFFFWPESIRWFIVIMMLWVLVWTYSSIFIASPLLYEANKNRIIKQYVKKDLSEDDKIVV